MPNSQAAISSGSRNMTVEQRIFDAFEDKDLAAQIISARAGDEDAVAFLDGFKTVAPQDVVTTLNALLAL